jgi:hypothetical protein
MRIAAIQTITIESVIQKNIESSPKIDSGCNGRALPPAADAVPTLIANKKRVVKNLPISV